jgi:hypothetical protein
MNDNLFINRIKQMKYSFVLLATTFAVQVLAKPKNENLRNKCYNEDNIYVETCAEFDCCGTITLINSASNIVSS